MGLILNSCHKKMAGILMSVCIFISELSLKFNTKVLTFNFFAFSLNSTLIVKTGFGKRFFITKDTTSSYKAQHSKLRANHTYYLAL